MTNKSIEPSNKKYDKIKFYASRAIIFIGFFGGLALASYWWTAQIMEEETYLSCDELKQQMIKQTRPIVNKQHIENLYMINCMPEVIKND